MLKLLEKGMAQIISDVSFGPVLKHELAAVAQLEADAFPPPIYPVFFFRQAFDLWPQLFWVARHQEKILGYLICSAEFTQSSRLSLMSFAVSPQAKGLGVGKGLLGRFLQELPGFAPQVRQIWLTADPDNLPALKLYQQHGFIQTAEELDYYGTDYHRVVLSVEIAPKQR